MIKLTILWFLIVSATVNASGLADISCDRQAGKSDSYILALSSQAGFCQTYGYEAGKPECRHFPSNSYQAKHLTLHGLWPNQNACGQRYGFCGVEQKSDHCAYRALDLSPQISNQLKKIMPSYNYGSCLERHEWNKHGSCQILSADNYFSLAMRLVTEVDGSALGTFLTEHQGQVVKLSQLQDEIIHAFGKTNIRKIYFGCKNGILVDVYIQLPAVIPGNASLESLIDEAPNFQNRNTCPQKIIISDFNKASWF